MEANGATAVCSNLVGMQNESALANQTVQQYATIGYADGQRVGFAGTMPANIAGLVSQPGRLVRFCRSVATRAVHARRLTSHSTSPRTRPRRSWRCRWPWAACSTKEVRWLGRCWPFSDAKLPFLCFIVTFALRDMQ